MQYLLVYYGLVWLLKLKGYCFVYVVFMDLYFEIVEDLVVLCCLK